MDTQLWPHQRAAVDAARQALAEGHCRGLWVMPTGTGKTRAFVTLAREMGASTLVVVHRDELARQAQGTSAQVWPEAEVGTIPGKGWERSKVVIATVQSLKNKLDCLPPDRFGLVVFDEAHHAPTRSWARVAGHFTPRLLLGCTATPDRLDGKRVDDLFGRPPLYTYELERAMAEGCLVPLRQHGVRTAVSLDGVPVRGGDFSDKQLAAAVATEARTQAVVEAHARYAADRLTLVFAVDLAHVEQIRQAFVAAGVPTASVTGKTPREERRKALADFGAGRLRVLVSCEVLTEGYDEKAIGAVIMARPTQSKALYQQCVGRGLRIYPEGGKPDCLVLDIIDRCTKHRLVAASDLFGAHVQDCRGQEARVAAEAEKARWHLEPLSPSPGLAWRWEARAERRWAQLPDLRSYRPRYAWQSAPATEMQLKALRSVFGFDVHRPLTKGEASHLIDDCKRLDRLYPTSATEGQEAMLRDRRLWRPGMTKREATRLIAKAMRRAS
jgi:superfamily II DNA or RNA helicase